MRLDESQAKVGAMVGPGTQDASPAPYTAAAEFYERMSVHEPRMICVVVKLVVPRMCMYSCKYILHMSLQLYTVCMHAHTAYTFTHVQVRIQYIYIYVYTNNMCILSRTYFPDHADT